jgi:hypothetical protein
LLVIAELGVPVGRLEGDPYRLPPGGELVTAKIRVRGLVAAFRCCTAARARVRRHPRNSVRTGGKLVGALAGVPEHLYLTASASRAAANIVARE